MNRNTAGNWSDPDAGFGGTDCATGPVRVPGRVQCFPVAARFFPDSCDYGMADI